MEFFLVESQFFRLVGQQKQHFLTLKTVWNFQGFFLKVNSISKDFASILPLFLSRKKVVKSIGDVFFQFKCRFVVKNARNVKFPQDVAENGLFFIQFHACLDWFINLYRGQERMGKEWKSEKKFKSHLFPQQHCQRCFLCTIKKYSHWLSLLKCCAIYAIFKLCYMSLSQQKHFLLCNYISMPCSFFMQENFAKIPQKKIIK